MPKLKVLRLYHSGVVDEYRQRERMLRERHGHDVHLICPPEWSEGGSLVRAAPADDEAVHVVKSYGRRHPILFWYAPSELRRIVRDVRPDIVDLHEEPYSLAVASALRVVKREAPAAKVCVYTAQNILKRYPLPFRQLERRALGRAAAAYPCSTEAGEVLRQKGYSGALHVIPLGVTMPQEPSGERSPLTVGFLGRIEPYKGGMIALEGFAQAARCCNAYLEFLGSGSQQTALRARAVQLGVEDRVLFPGPRSQDEALNRIGEYAAVVMPSLTTRSWKEQFGRVAVQAMAASTPVIASASGSLREIVGDTGVLVPEGDATALAGALRRLLTDRELRVELGRAGRRAASERFTWVRVADQVHEMYARMVAS